MEVMTISRQVPLYSTEERGKIILKDILKFVSYLNF